MPKTLCFLILLPVLDNRTCHVRGKSKTFQIRIKSLKLERMLTLQCFFANFFAGNYVHNTLFVLKDIIISLMIFGKNAQKICLDRNRIGWRNFRAHTNNFIRHKNLVSDYYRSILWTRKLLCLKIDYFQTWIFTGDLCVWNHHTESFSERCKTSPTCFHKRIACLMWKFCLISKSLIFVIEYTKCCYFVFIFYNS